MRITLLQTGKTRDDYLLKGINEFNKRLVRYVPFKMETIPDLKNSRHMTMKEVQKKEGVQILRKIKPEIFVILLDERGEEFTSISFAEHLNSLEGRVNHIMFVIGGPYGFSEEVYNRANEKFSLSRLTFSHQMVRLLFMEQLYRTFTILKGEPYHHA